MAETELFRTVGLPYGKVFEDYDLWLPRVQLHCDFHHPALLDDLLTVSAFIGRIGNKSLTLNFEVYRAKDEILLSEGRFIMVAVSRKDFKSMALPQGLIEKLARFSC
jgi:YbgC/YbaW family acyl-CoA thioester hydrolase